MVIFLFLRNVSATVIPSAAKTILPRKIKTPARLYNALAFVDATVPNLIFEPLLIP